nr:Dur31.2 [Starmerella bombicola]
MSPLSQGVGYGVVVGVGIAFALGMIAVTSVLQRYSGKKMTSDEFATAGRSTKSGLIACAVVSSWTWTATLLVSTSQAYSSGVSGALFYAIGGSIACLLFAMLAMEIKLKAPKCHTYLEVIKCRFGPLAHLVFMFFALASNIITTAELLAGAAASVTFISGMHEVAATFLIVLPVTLYTLFGGLKATFLTDYVHTLILIITLAVLIINVYAFNPLIGSPGKLYELVQDLTNKEPISGNHEGSLLTMRSRLGALFFVIVIPTGITPVFLDQGYWNKAIAASPSSVLPGYIFGSLAWFAIPWACATALGLAARVLEHTTVWPTYPTPMSKFEVSQGLVLPQVATALLGKKGAGAALILVFMSATSASSAEMVSASSIWTYDLYKTYINPNASGQRLIFMTHAGVIVFILAMIGFSLGLYYGNVSLGYLFDLMGMICGSAVIPATLTLFWSGLNKWSVSIAPILGVISGVAAFVGTTAGLFPSITVETSGTDFPMIAGILVSMGSPILWIFICQLIWGHAHYDFSQLQDIGADFVCADGEIPHSVTIDGAEKDNDAEQVFELTDSSPSSLEKEAAELRNNVIIARWACFGLTVALAVVWAWPMYGSKYVFSREFFTGWVSVSIAWLMVSLLYVGLAPIWQGWPVILHVSRSILKDLIHFKVGSHGDNLRD